MLKPINIGIWGAGNLAYHWAQLFKNSATVQIYNRTPAKVNAIAQETGALQVNNLATLLANDFVFLALSDDAIQDVTQACTNSEAIIIHSSGAKPISVLNKLNKPAVVYPLQTFTKGEKLNYSTIPFFIESSTNEVSQALLKLFEQVNISLKKLNSKDRLLLHTAAVFTSNFINAQFIAAHKLLGDKAIHLFPHLKTLSEEVVRKAFANKPTDVQTGPAKRNDTGTMQQHIELLDTQEQELYKHLSAYIKNTFTT